MRLVLEHRSRVAKEKEVASGQSGFSLQVATPTPVVKLPPVAVKLDDVGRITRRKVPVVRPIVWDVWDRNAPSFGYESLGLVMRNSVFPGRNLLAL